MKNKDFTRACAGIYLVGNNNEDKLFGNNDIHSCSSHWLKKDSSCIHNHFILAVVISIVVAWCNHYSIQFNLLHSNQFMVHEVLYTCTIWTNNIHGTRELWQIMEDRLFHIECLIGLEHHSQQLSLIWKIYNTLVYSNIFRKIFLPLQFKTLHSRI